MAFKVNYGLERAERNRAKLAKREAKSLARKEHEKVATGAETSKSGFDPNDATSAIVDEN
jgi:hypothetical protein